MTREMIWSVIYIVFAGGVAWLLYSNWAFLRDSYRELRYKVTWPGQKEVRGTTIVVLITTFAFALYLFLCDAVLQKTIIAVLRYFKS
jgi:preprotein translocase SecE subunit